MATKKNETVLTDAEIEETRVQVRAILDSGEMNQREISDESGVKYGTFTAWRAGTYTGDNSRVAEEVQIWLASRDEKKRELSKVPEAPGFVATPSAVKFVEALHFAQVMPEICVIAGSAGIGKTTATEQYQGSHPNVWTATMSPSCASVNPMLREVCESIGVSERSAGELFRAIGRKVRGTGGLLIVDEAQHLASASLDQLRSVYDQYKIGIALVGNISVYSRLEGDGNKAGFAQLYSRIGVRVTQLKPGAKDMCALIDAWGVTDRDEIKTLKSIATKPGALRSMTKCLQLASMLAAGAGEERGIKHIRAAYQRLSTHGE